MSVCLAPMPSSTNTKNYGNPARLTARGCRPRGVAETGANADGSHLPAQQKDVLCGPGGGWASGGALVGQRSHCLGWPGEHAQAEGALETTK